MFDGDRMMDPRIRRAQQHALRANEREITVGKVDIYLKTSAERLRGEGIPLTTKGDVRIDMMAFGKSIYSGEVIAQDQRYVAMTKKQWQDERARLGQKEEDDSDKKLHQGERLEMLKTALFQKYLGQDFIVVRSSEYDDVVGGVDNVIVDRRSGNLVCAFDEVGEDGGPVFEKKKNRVMVKNELGGARLKYGFSVREGQIIILGPIDNIPIFYLAMSPDKIEAVLRSFDEQGRLGQDGLAFKSFLDLILTQIDELAKLDVKTQATLKEKAMKMGVILKQYQNQ